MRASVLTSVLAAGLVLAAITATPAGAQDVAAGRKVAARVCQACHGLDGIAKQPDAANLAAQDAGYLTRQLAAFREGKRENEQMSLIAKTLSEAQMADVAAYYSAITIEVRSVPGSQ